MRSGTLSKPERRRVHTSLPLRPFLLPRWETGHERTACYLPQGPGPRRSGSRTLSSSIAAAASPAPGLGSERNRGSSGGAGRSQRAAQHSPVRPGRSPSAGSSRPTCGCPASHPPRRRAGVTANEFESLWERLGTRLEEAAKAFEAESREAPSRVDEFLALPLRERTGRHFASTPSQAAALVLELLTRARRNLERGQPWGAIPQLRGALAILRRSGTVGEAGLRELASEVQSELGEAWRLVGLYDWASRCFCRASQILKDSPDSSAHARFCAGLARLRCSQERGDEAVALWARAATLWAEVGDREKSAEARAELSLARLQFGELDDSAGTPPRKPRRTISDYRPRARRRR